MHVHVMMLCADVLLLRSLQVNEIIQPFTHLVIHERTTVIDSSQRGHSASSDMVPY